MSLGWHLLTGMDFNITEMSTEAKGTIRVIASYPNAQVLYVETRDIKVL